MALKKMIHEIAQETHKQFTKNEISHYAGAFSSHSVFKSPQEEYEHNKTQFKDCNKCGDNLSLNEFGNNTSGKDPFDKNGYRLKRGDCADCNKKIKTGKTHAIAAIKKLGMDTKAPEGTECELCKSTDKIVFDHHHTLNSFRGWLCNGCNRSIGMLGEDMPSIVRVINYLNKLDNVALHFDEETKELKIV